jgi:hypothetical protein
MEPPSRPGFYSCAILPRASVPFLNLPHVDRRLFQVLICHHLCPRTGMSVIDGSNPLGCMRNGALQ